MRRTLRTGLLVLVVGLVLAVPAAAVLVVRAVRVFDAPTVTTPASVQRHLSPGTWVVFERTATRGGLGGLNVTRTATPELQPSDVIVTAPDGHIVPVGLVTINEAITRGTGVYDGVLQFTIDTPGTYTLQVLGPPRQVIVARSLSESFHGFLGIAAIAGVGGVLVLTGLVLLVVSAVRGSRAPRYPAPALTLTPAGWYPDPSGRARVRWWDGARWTDHSA